MMNVIEDRAKKSEFFENIHSDFRMFMDLRTHPLSETDIFIAENPVAESDFTDVMQHAPIRVFSTSFTGNPIIRASLLE